MSITITEKAAVAVKSTIKDEAQKRNVPEDKFLLRMRVEGGGCSGFQHKLDLDFDVTKRDEVFQIQGIPVVVDKRSLMYLSDVTVDYHDDLNRRGFSIQNPKAKSTCGCGSSFSM
jgi:iron-sulfur cluster assembly protein